MLPGGADIISQGLHGKTVARVRWTMRLFILLLLGFLTIFGVAYAQSRYVLQPGDTVEISVLQDPTLNRKIVIGPDGTISFPLAGHMRAAGLTAEALEMSLTKRLSKNYKSKLAVTVTLGQVSQGLGSRIYITGQVNKPGPYPITPGTHVMQAIALSGGLARFAAGSRIQIHRRVAGEERVFVFDYNAFESGKNLEGNIPLEPGDVIVVPERGLFI
jgi:polysaccharide export outer membrane protein